MTAAIGTNDLRQVVKWYACKMEQVLRKNDWKEGWDKMSLLDLMARLGQESDELYNEIQACVDHPNIINLSQGVKEAVDVANFSMFIADVLAQRLKKLERSEVQ